MSWIGWILTLGEGVSVDNAGIVGMEVRFVCRVWSCVGERSLAWRGDLR